jgi:branched-chain amino acid transport system ATP-binding protein
MSAWALEVQHLHKRYGGLSVVDGVSLRLAPGARHALIGPNGAGKTTLVGLLSGVIRPDAGRVTLFGVDVTHATPRRRTLSGLARTFQINNLFRGLTVLENVFIAVSERAGVSGNFQRPAHRRKDLLAEAEGVIESLGLHEDIHRKVAEISYGHQRLVEIGMALSLRPKVLLLDEPIAGIEKADTERVLQVLGRLPADIAVLIIEHDMQVVCRLAQEVTVLVAGQVLTTGRPADVMRSEEVRAVYLGQNHHDRATSLLAA